MKQFKEGLNVLNTFRILYISSYALSKRIKTSYGFRVGLLCCVMRLADKTQDVEGIKPAAGLHAQRRPGCKAAVMSYRSRATK